MKDEADKVAKQPENGISWSPWVGVIYVLGVFYISQFLASIAILSYPGLRHWTDSHTTHWLNTSVPAQFVFVLLAEGLAVGGIYVFLKRNSSSLAAIGFKKPAWFDPLLGVAAVIPYFVLYGIAVAIVGHFFHGLNVNQQQDIGFNSVHGNQQLILTFISLVILPPIAEEIMVRGFLYSTLKKAMPVFTAALATSAIFGAAHLGEGGSAGLLWIGFIDTFVLSMVLIWLREQTGNLWASITLHAIKNGVAFTALFVLHVH
ncbi:MAG TPA: CPBP family intramembrane glutamic endopeptidase [Candidatus Saccharimonadales bacterium]|nr:CPBP family intramembrane glutamic endopeptidase [Candidatus Saccharimonadales bacterium]